MSYLQDCSSSSPCCFHVDGLYILELLLVFNYEQVTLYRGCMKSGSNQFFFNCMPGFLFNFQALLWHRASWSECASLLLLQMGFWFWVWFFSLPPFPSSLCPSWNYWISLSLSEMNWLWLRTTIFDDDQFMIRGFIIFWSSGNICFISVDYDLYCVDELEVILDQNWSVSNWTKLLVDLV